MLQPRIVRVVLLNVGELQTRVARRGDDDSALVMGGQALR
jgi:hypothetical protein